MRRFYMKAFFATLFLTIVAATAAGAQERPRRLSILPAVQKIYVGDMGNDDEAERFRLLLEEQLLKRGFTVVAREDEADATLTGALSVRVYDEKAEARVSVRLTSNSTSEVMWAKEFGHKRIHNPFSLQEPTKRRAEEVAEALRREFRKPGSKHP